MQRGCRSCCIGSLYNRQSWCPIWPSTEWSVGCGAITQWDICCQLVSNRFLVHPGPHQILVSLSRQSLQTHLFLSIPIIETLTQGLIFSHPDHCNCLLLALSYSFLPINPKCSCQDHFPFPPLWPHFPSPWITALAPTPLQHQVQASAQSQHSPELCFYHSLYLQLLSFLTCTQTSLLAAKVVSFDQFWWFHTIPYTKNNLPREVSQARLVCLSCTHYHSI